MTQVDKVIEKYFAKDPTEFHAVSFSAVNKEGRKLHSTSYGTQKVDGSGGPVTEDSIFWMASMAKIFTAVAVMIAVEKGIIGLDDDVGDVVPKLKNPDVLVGFEDEDDGKPILRKAVSKITLRRLLTHSSGFVYAITNENLKKWFAYHKLETDMDPGSINGYYYPLAFEPGEHWGYGPGVDWAGHVVETASSQKLEQFMKENIFDKIELEATTFHPEKHPEFETRRVELGMRGSDGNFAAGSIPYPIPAKDDLGGIGLYSTPKEYIKFLGTLLKGGGDILSPESVDEIFASQLPSNSVLNEIFNKGSSRMNRLLTSGKIIDMGLSVCINLDEVPGCRSANSVSWGGMANTFWWLDRKAGVCAALFLQMFPPVDASAIELLDEIETAFYQELEP